MSSNPSGRTLPLRFLKSGRAWLWVSAIVCGTSIFVQTPLPFPRAAAGLAPLERTVNAAIVPATAAATASANARQDVAPASFPIPAMSLEPTDVPRECRLEAGIDTACVFH